MLSELSSSELREWADYFSESYFFDAQIDAHFASLEYLTLGLHVPRADLSITDFSLLQRVRSAVACGNMSQEMSGEQIMAAAQGIAGGLRFEPE